MRNQHAAVSRRLSDPDFQGSIVRACLTSVLFLAALLAVFAMHDAWVWTHPPEAKYFVIDGNSTPRPIIPVDSPIVDETQLLEWTVRWVLAPYNVNYHDLPAAAEHGRSALHPERLEQLCRQLHLER